MRKNIRNIISILIVMGIVISMPSFSYATSLDEIDEQVEDTQNKIDDINKKKQEEKNNISNLQNEADNLGDQYNEYSSRLQSVTSQIASAESAMKSTSAEIVSLSKDLEVAKAKKQEQYEIMKLHIKYMYENQSKQVFLIYILRADSLTEFLNRAEFAYSIIKNDEKVVAAYQELEDTIAGKSEELKVKEAELDSYQKSLDSKKMELAILKGQTEADIDNTNDKIDDAKDNLEVYNAKLKELDVKMKGLEKQQAEAQAAIARQIAAQQEAERQAAIQAAIDKAVAEAAAEAEANGEDVDAAKKDAEDKARAEAEKTQTENREDTSGAIVYAADELTLLAATIQAEADGESYAGKLAVGSVIMNRVKSSKFPNSLAGVITQNKQFASYSSGKVSYLVEQGPNDTCIQAAREVLEGQRTGDWLFFMTQPCADSFGITGYTMIGNHAFFYKWGAN